MTSSIDRRASRPPVLLTLVIAILSMTVQLGAQSSPGEKDFLTATAGLGLAVGVELMVKDNYLPEQPRFSKPNSIDSKMREMIYWGSNKQKKASRWSDLLIYGVSVSSLAWGPLVSENPERSALINMEVFAVNSLVTNTVKILTARQRPYSYYETAPSEGPVDYASFFSGHSSVAFSQAVTNAMILSDHFPENKDLIWTSLVGLAGVTAYLRVAGDMHYFSDIVVGAGVGALIAWTITRHELNRYSQARATDGFMFTFKIPLG